MLDRTPRKIGIFTIGPDLRITSWGPDMVSLLGIPSEEALGKDIRELGPEPIPNSFIERLKKVMTEGTTEVLSPALHRYLIKCQPPEGAKYFDHMRQKVTITPLIREDSIQGAFVTLEDVTLRMEWEREMAEALRNGDEETRVRAAEALAKGAETPAQYLLGSIGDKSWRVRQVAVKTLSANTSKEVLEQLLRTLRREHANIHTLNSILQILSLSQEDISETLIGFLSDPDPELRIYSAMVLGERKERSAIPALIKALEDEDKNVVYHAIEALGKLRAYEARERLFELALKDDFFLAFPAISSLTQIGDTSMAPRLVPLLNNPLLSSAALEALGALGEPDTVVPLIELINQRKGSTGKVCEAIISIHERYMRRCGDSEVPRLVSEHINQTGAEHLLDALRTPDSEHHTVIIKILGWVRSPAVAKGLISASCYLGAPTLLKELVESFVNLGEIVVDGILKRLDGMDIQSKKAAIIALGRIGSRESVPALIEQLRSSPELIQVTAGALAKIGDRRAFEPLLEFLGHEDPGVRLSVIGALNSIGHPDMSKHMKGYLKDPNPRVRASAVTIAGYFGYPECVDDLLDCVIDPDPEVRRSAVEQLPYLEDERVSEYLSKALKDPDPRVRSSAIRALGEMEVEGKIGFIMEGLKDPSPLVRYFTAKTIGRKRLPLVEELVELLAFDPAMQVRIAAIKALKHFRDERSIMVLKRSAESDQIDVACVALEAMGVFSDPLAHSTLREAIKSRDPERRLCAVKGISQSDMKDKVFLLHRVAASDLDNETAKEAIVGLAHMRDPQAILCLLDLATDPAKRGIVLEALSAESEAILPVLEELTPSAGSSAKILMLDLIARLRCFGTKELLGLLLKDRDWEVRKAACELVAELGSQRFVETLINIRERDESPYVKDSAQKALLKLGI